MANRVKSNYGQCDIVFVYSTSSTSEQVPVLPTQWQTAVQDPSQNYPIYKVQGVLFV